MRYVLLLLSIGFFSSANVTATDPPKLIAVDGACGEFTFSKRIGTDRESALEAFPRPKIIPMNETERVLIGVNTFEKGNKAKKVKLHLVKFVDPITKLHSASPSEAIDDSGNLYWLHWCPD